MVDIAKRRLRTPVSPDITLSDDPLRSLRAFRFALAFGFRLDLELVRAIKRSAILIRDISVERVRTELVKLLLLDRPSRGIRLLQITGLLRIVIPEVAAMAGVTQNRFHDRDAFEHSLAAVDATPGRINARLGALFHDIGKVSTRTDVDGKVQFIRHSTVGAAITRKLMRRLKFPNQQISDVAMIVERHMDLKDGGPDASMLKDATLRRFIHHVGENLDDTLDVIHADNVSHAPEYDMPLQIGRVRERISGWDLAKYMNPELSIDGHDVVELGVSGPRIGEILERIKWHHIKRDGLDRESALQIAKDMVASNHSFTSFPPEQSHGIIN